MAIESIGDDNLHKGNIAEPSIFEKVLTFEYPKR